jgi:hypothetical protein
MQCVLRENRRREGPALPLGVYEFIIIIIIIIYCNLVVTRWQWLFYM